MSAGEIIYKGESSETVPCPDGNADVRPAFMPTLKMGIGIGLGYTITKAGMFTPQMAKGVSILSLVSDIRPGHWSISSQAEHIPSRSNLRIYGPIIHINKYISVRWSGTSGDNVYGDRCGVLVDRQGDLLRPVRFPVGDYSGE